MTLAPSTGQYRQYTKYNEVASEWLTAVQYPAWIISLPARARALKSGDHFEVLDEPSQECIWERLSTQHVNVNVNVNVYEQGMHY